METCTKWGHYNYALINEYVPSSLCMPEKYGKKANWYKVDFVDPKKYKYKVYKCDCPTEEGVIYGAFG